MACRELVELGKGSILDADPPAQGVKIARRITSIFPIIGKSSAALSDAGGARTDFKNAV
jgi:hypothetical protein